MITTSHEQRQQWDSLKISSSGNKSAENASNGKGPTGKLSFIGGRLALAQAILKTSAILSGAMRSEKEVVDGALAQVGGHGAWDKNQTMQVSESSRRKGVN